MMASEQMSVKPFCHRQVSRANDLDWRAKAQPIMAPRNDFRDTKAEYMTVRHHRTKHVLAKREGSIHDKTSSCIESSVRNGQRLATGNRRGSTVSKYFPGLPAIGKGLKSGRRCCGTAPPNTMGAGLWWRGSHTFALSSSGSGPGSGSVPESHRTGTAAAISSPDSAGHVMKSCAHG